MGETFRDPETVTGAFLTAAAELHRKYMAPCTLFVLGQVLEKNVRHFQEIASEDMFDIQQHTYSHTRLKTVVEEHDGSVNVYGSGTLGDIAQDITEASSLLKKCLQVNCIGLSGPYGYHRGLSDKPEVLEILQDAGIGFVRAYTRNEQDWGPVALDVQPFWYKPQGFPKILEIPGQDHQDCHYREIHGWENTEGYLSHLKSSLEYVARHDLTWSVCFHDFSSIRDDPKMTIVSGLIEHARKRHVRIITCKEYYEEKVALPGELTAF